MDTNDELLIKRKIYISTVGWIGIIISGLMIYFSVWDIITILLTQQNPVLKDLQSSGSEAISQTFSSVYYMSIGIYGLLIFWGIFFLVSSIGLIKYKNWGRIIFIIVSVMLIVFSVLAIVYYLLSANVRLNEMLPSAISLPAFNEMSGLMNTLFKVQIAGYLILLLFVLRTLFRIIWRFKHDDYKQLFI